MRFALNLDLTKKGTNLKFILHSYSFDLSLWAKLIRVIRFTKIGLLLSMVLITPLVQPNSLLDEYLILMAYIGNLKLDQIKHPRIVLMREFSLGM